LAKLTSYIFQKAEIHLSKKIRYAATHALKSDNQIRDFLTANLSTAKIIHKRDENFPSPLFKYVDIG